MSQSPNIPEPETSLEVRAALVHALHIDLIGPSPESEHAEESLPGWERPSVWYLTGFLVPTGTPAAERADDEEDDDFDGEVPERGPGRGIRGARQAGQAALLSVVDGAELSGSPCRHHGEDCRHLGRLPQGRAPGSLGQNT